MNWQTKVSVLSFILAIGFLLRIYNLNFPSIGYHSVMENEYLSIAQEMTRTQNYINKRIYFYNGLEDKASLKRDNQPAMISYQTIFAWRLLGENLWGPRLFNILFGVASIMVIYAVSALLFNNLYLAIFSAFLLAIMPLAVFFSRNIQPESPAFFFMLLGHLFYLKFICTFKKYNLFLGGLSFILSWLYRFNFLLGIIPFLLCFPFRELYKKKHFVRCVVLFILPYVLILVIIWKLNAIGQWDLMVFKPINCFKFFSPSFLKRTIWIVWLYAKQDNFTPIYTSLTLIGILLAIFKRKGLLTRYIFGWFLAFIVYFLMYAPQMGQNNFYQMPFLILVCIASCYTLAQISEIITKVFKINLLLFFMLLVFGISIPFVYQSILRMHATVFLGMDVAGESLREFTQPEERIFLFTHAQGQGIARYARRYVGWTSNLDDFKDKERKFNIRYICFYPAEFAGGLKTDHPLLFEYIQNNYHPKEVGLLEGSRVIYIILEKGKGSPPEMFLDSFSGPTRVRTIYRMFNRFIFFYTMAPQIR
ncbi:MAG: glycosyltransferase family 39 protein [Candidatus Omnitrophica bacterium]|nr:glycosyltransferase family 39 protein [Candidatus Omnitrophota bacterium]